jgi:alcohol dehydrogenase class IV
VGYNSLFVPQKVIYGSGTARQLGAEAKLLGRKALVVSDPVMEKSGLVAEHDRILREAGIEAAVYTGVASEPTDQYVEQGLALCREHGCDLVVAIGGGSCIDTAKAVAVMMTNEGYIGDYMGAQARFGHPALPLIAVPTTAGTGSEVTKVTVITDTRRHIKMMISQPELLPRIAIVDPLLTRSCPPHVTAATGVDALCHAIEAYLSRRAHPVTDSLALGAMSRLAGNLVAAYRDGNEIGAREQTATGSMMAGMAFSNASVALVHGMSRPIGALFHIPHGVSNAMLLPAVLEFTRDSAIERLADIGKLISPTAEAASIEGWADAAIGEVKRLCRTLNIPNLRSWGVDREKFAASLAKMADDAIASGSPDNNPRIPTHSEIITLYERCYDYK